MYQREKAFLIKTAYLAAVLAVGWLILRYALVWLLPFLLALGFAALMEPVITLARRKLRLKRGFLAAVLTLALLALVIALGAVLVGQVIRQATDLMERLPELLSALPVLADRITARRHAQRTAHNVAHRCHKGHRRITLTADAARDAA